MARNSWLGSNRDAHRLLRESNTEKWERGEVLGKDLSATDHPLTGKQLYMLAVAAADGFVVVDRRDNSTRNRLRKLGLLTITNNIGSACQCEITDKGRDSVPTFLVQGIVESRQRDQEIRDRIKREDELLAIKSRTPNIWVTLPAPTGTPAP